MVSAFISSAVTLPRFTSGCPLGMAAIKGSSYSGAIAKLFSGKGSAKMAQSMSPLRSSSSSRTVKFSCSSNGICGALAIICRTKSGSKYGPMVWMTPSRKLPASGSLPRLAISLMWSACSSTLCAWRIISSPNAVTVISLALRSKSLTCSSSSSFLMATLNVGCDTWQASAPLPKCFSRATATMYLSSVNVMRLLCSV